MTSTLVLEIVTSDGDACWRSFDRVEYQRTPPSSFDEWQPGVIPVDVAHQTRPIGWVDYLECRPDEYNGSLMAVAVVDAEADLVDGLFASPSLRANAMHTVERHSYRLDRKVAAYGTLTATHTTLDGVGIVTATAGITSTRIRAFPGDYRDVIDWGQMKARRPPPILERARAEARHELRYRRPPHIRINRPPEPRYADYDVRNGGGGEIVRHGGGYVLSVH